MQGLGELAAGFHALPDVLQDSVVVESPLPGGAATLARFLLQSVPRWVQIGGVIVGGIVAIFVVYILWTRRLQIVTSLATQSTQVKIGIAAAVVLLLVGFGTAGAVSWNYMQHDNGFCTGCHVMETAFFRFEESEHDSLNCHDCHQQSIFASTRQLYLWVAERPDEIGEHAPVANAVCETCHMTGEPEVWQRVASTAGHRTHLESDSVDVMCVTCHGQEVHAFVPVDQTCGQSDCHVSSDTEIAIGAMAEQTSLHCITCHEFVAEVPALATRDSAAATLVPGMDRCTSCHEMREVLEDFDPNVDPHGGTCGSCHFPHEQDVARDAEATCASSDCHADWETEPFHTGTAHARVGTQCTMCHEPHRSQVDASDCLACHNAVAGRADIPDEIRRRLRRIEPFDTSAVLRRSPIGAAVGQPQEAAGPIRSPPDLGFWGIGLTSIPPLVPLPFAPQAPVAQPDSFSHNQHDDLTCLNCHTTDAGEGPLRFEPPRGCQICHHQAPLESVCDDCHTSAELTVSLASTVTVMVADSPSRVRDAEFSHDVHGTESCVTCHLTPVTLATSESAGNCTDCHLDHHTADRACVQCHDNDEQASVTAHSPPTDAHVACDECHELETVRELFPDDQFCSTCHDLKPDHPSSSGRACTECHFLVPPEEFRRHLVGTGRSP